MLTLDNFLGSIIEIYLVIKKVQKTGNIDF